MKKGIIFSFIVSIIMVMQIVSVPLVHAETNSVTGLIPCTKSPGPSKEPSGLNCDTWEDLVGVIQFMINYSFILATILATVSFSYAGWLYLTSNGDSGKIATAHKIFIKVVQGFLVLAMAYLLVKTILTQISFPEYNKLQ
jgi:hypothetical protein